MKKELKQADEIFCQLVAAGEKTLRECVREAYPKYAHAKPDTIDRRGERLVKRKDLLERVSQICRETKAKTEEKYSGLREEMIERMVRGIRAGTDGDPMTIVEFSKTIDILAKIHGWYAPTDVTVRNGGISADYRPPTLMSMTDQEISQRLAALRDGSQEQHK